MRRVAVLTLGISLFLTGTAHAGTRWGADAFSAPEGGVADAQSQMEHQFQSLALYVNLGGDPASFGSWQYVVQAQAGAELLYVNVNSRTPPRTPICWYSVAVGKHDAQIDAWAEAFKAINQGLLIVTFNHEPAVLNSTGNQPKCASDTYINYRAAFAHFVNRLRSDGVTARMAYVGAGFMFEGSWLGDWLATHWEPNPALFQVVGADLYRRRSTTAAWQQLGPVLRWRNNHAAGKPVLIGELGAAKAVTSAQWINDWGRLARANNLIALEWNLRTDYPTDFNPLYQTAAVKTAWINQSQPFLIQPMLGGGA